MQRREGFRKSKGQAAMEYLMTYGWAILIVLAIMAILVYLVRPQQIETCIVAVPLQCVPEYYTIDTTGNLTIKLQNLGSVKYKITQTQCGAGIITYVPEKVLPAGGFVDLNFNCTSEIGGPTTITPGKDVFKKTVQITYYPEGAPTFLKTQQIEIAVRFGKPIVP